MEEKELEKKQLAKEIFNKIYDLDFEGLDSEVTNRTVQHAVVEFWEAVREIRRKYVSDEEWNR